LRSPAIGQKDSVLNLKIMSSVLRIPRLKLTLVSMVVKVASSVLTYRRAEKKNEGCRSGRYEYDTGQHPVD
jgi:hypothetical protein